MALDEVNQIFEHPQVAKDILPMLRSWYEEAKRLPIWQKLRLIILKSERQSVRLLELYRQILQLGEVVSVDSPESRELLLSGLVVKQQGSLRVYNRIYELIFDSSWIELHI